MQEHYFLFALTLVFTIFATIQDLRTREVANWLTFSLIAFALAYRAFFSVATKNIHFFLLGLLGFIVMLVLGNIFYYSKAFAGGDAKLLMGFGAIIPYQTYSHLLLFPIAFILLLFLAGALWSLAFSIFIVAKNKKSFVKEFKNLFKKYLPLLIFSLALFAISLVAGFLQPLMLFIIPLSLIPILFIYTLSLEKCMIVLLPPNKLTEGDWLEKEIRLGKTTIKKSVHGLSYKEIQLLKKYNRPALIKQGIPFVPAFLIALIIMVLASATSLFPLPFSFLF